MIASPRDVRRLLRVAFLIAVVAVVAPDRHAAAAEFHHVHLTVTDPVAAAKWYAQHIGGQAKKFGFLNGVDVGDFALLFFQAKEGFAKSDTSAVDHIGFSYKDIHAKMKELEDGGVDIVSGVEQEGPIKYAFVRDPWGTLIEVVEDPDLLGFHHVHLAVPDPAAALGWYTSAFGGEVTRFAGILPGIRYGDMWVLIKKVKEPRAATKGRSIDHISWAFDDLDEEAARLQGAGVNFESKPFTFGTNRIAFVVDPDGVRIELVGPARKK